MATWRGSRSAFLFVLTTLVPAAATLAQGSALGEWESTTPGLGALATVEVVANRARATVKASAPCGAGTCDWGTVAGGIHYETIAGDSAFHMVTAAFETSYSTTWLILIPKPGALLEAQVITRYKAPDKRYGTYVTQTLKRKPSRPAAPPADECVILDPTKFHAKEIRGAWWLMCGEGALATFRTRQDAERAAEVARTLKFDRRCQVGKPKAMLYYYLARGAAPQGQLAGEDCRAFDPAALKVVGAGGRFRLMDGPSALLDLGPSQADANLALALIRKHGFRKLCHVGRPDPGLTYMEK